MKQLAPGVWRLRQVPIPSVNVYLAEDVLIDAGARFDRGRIRAELEGREISMLALTHAHPDHQGVAKEICESRGIPLACHAEEVDAMEGRRPLQEADPKHPFNRLARRFMQGPPHQVSRVLREGDEVAGFRVVHAPGHARGHVIFFRDSDRVAICGDVIRNMSYLSGRPMIAEPPPFFTADPTENRRSIRKLAALEPALILPGHGPALTDMDRFHRFAVALPE